MANSTEFRSGERDYLVVIGGNDPDSKHGARLVAVSGSSHLTRKRKLMPLEIWIMLIAGAAVIVFIWLGRKK